MRIVLVLLLLITASNALLLRGVHKESNDEKERKLKSGTGGDTGCGGKLSDETIFAFGLDPSILSSMCDEADAQRSETCVEPANVPTGVNTAVCDNVTKFCPTGLSCYIIRDPGTYLGDPTSVCSTEQGLTATYDIQPYAAEMICDSINILP